MLLPTPSTENALPQEANPTQSGTGLLDLGSARIYKWIFERKILLVGMGSHPLQNSATPQLIENRHRTPLGE
jgi:hypothetical protein